MSYLLWVLRTLRFPFYFGFEVVKTTLVVLWDVLTPGSSSVPAFVEVPTRCRSDFETTMLANMISLTPGTVTVAVGEERPATLWVHGLYVEDRPSFREDIHTMEDHLLAVTRPRAGVPPRPETADSADRGER
ncbi:Na+/H+ antiporter subunit E [Nocardiopsis sp. HNM0947]|uniref:Na+/H+ antiporter subunit E n=1 Tax=Nocardiopsis coralli TaxID=2772213 RepID=A0ABR9P3E2_9ACTN|nr:Na+/H+ antiporter subunit E [Nocardiopsis coralli]MBE2998371.1 Na+/H+ antiporter subunit E [Nocardiopsis coralli]